MQYCRALKGNFPGDLLGRIVVNGKCLTISPAESDHDPYFALLKPCTSNTNPSVAQTWRYGTDDTSGSVTWVRILVEQDWDEMLMLLVAQAGPKSFPHDIGYTILDDGSPSTTGTGQLILGCDNQCESFGIRPALK